MEMPIRQILSCGTEQLALGVLGISQTYTNMCIICLIMVTQTMTINN